MKYNIESEELQIEVNSIGMELSSIRSTQTDREYLWQGDPTFWKGQAPVLFPIVGALKAGQLQHNGKNYQLPRHGFVRNSEKPTLIEQTPTKIRMGMSWDAETMTVYPFKFKLELQFLVTGKTVEIQHQIWNEGDAPMLFSIGAHPAFNCPLLPTETYEDYFLEFDQEEYESTYLIDPSGLISLDQELILAHTNELPLHAHLFDGDALVFKTLNSRKVSLVSRTSGPLVAVDFEDFNYLGIWATPQAPFVCIEPWLGIADSVASNQVLTDKEGILTLLPGESTRKTYSISILEE